MIAARSLIAAAYDGQSLIPIIGPLAAYLALFHVCGPAAKNPERYRRPPFKADIFSIWAAAAGPRARAVIRREGEHIVCPELGTRYPIHRPVPAKVVRAFRRAVILNLASTATSSRNRKNIATSSTTSRRGSNWTSARCGRSVLMVGSPPEWIRRFDELSFWWERSHRTLLERQGVMRHFAERRRSA
jgi:hypothetical protein